MAAGHDATLQSPHFASAGPPPGIGGRRNSIQLLEALSTSRRGSIDWQNPGMAAELANVNGAANQWTLPSQLQDASNGAQLNGAQLNGAQLNGAQLNGVQMPMHPQLGGLAGGLAPGLTGGLAGQPGGQQGLQQGGQQVREQFKQSVIEVASFLHQVRTTQHPFIDSLSSTSCHRQACHSPCSRAASSLRTPTRADGYVLAKCSTTWACLQARSHSWRDERGVDSWLITNRFRV